MQIIKLKKGLLDNFPQQKKLNLNKTQNIFRTASPFLRVVPYYSSDD